MQQEITRAIFLTLKGYSKVKLAWAGPVDVVFSNIQSPLFP